MVLFPVQARYVGVPSIPAVTSSGWSPSASTTQTSPPVEPLVRHQAANESDFLAVRRVARNGNLQAVKGPSWSCLGLKMDFGCAGTSVVGTVTGAVQSWATHQLFSPGASAAM